MHGIANEAIRHYSGTVVYKREIIRPESGPHFVLDLGEVNNMAELWCNGKKVVTRWAPSFKFDLLDQQVKEKNQLEVRVTNTWHNQLVFDNTRPNDAMKTWTTNPPKKSDTELTSSGLVGPVVLRYTKK